jgi:type I restriction enzyme S subunit
MMPNGWKLTTLGEVCSNNLQTGPFGSQLHAHEYTKTGIPVLMPKDIINQRANLNSAAKISSLRAIELAKHKLKIGDILFSRRGDVARFALIDRSSEGALCGTGCLKASINDEHSSLFLSYFLQKNAVKKWLEQNAVGQTMLNMNTAILRELPLMVASSKEEESKIAKILSTWDKAIIATERLINNSKQQKKAMAQQLFTGKNRFCGYGGEWNIVGLGKLLIEGKERNKFNGVSRVLSVTNHSGFVLPEEQFSKRVASKDVSNYKVIHQGQFGYNPSRLNVGSFARLESYSVGILSPMYVIFSIDELKVNSDYFLHWMSSNEAKQRILGSTQGSVRDSVKFDALSRFPFSLPPLEEQQKIAFVLTNLDKKIKLIQQQLADLKQEKKALMQQLLTGKRRVKIGKEAV